MPWYLFQQNNLLFLIQLLINNSILIFFKNLFIDLKPRPLQIRRPTRREYTYLYHTSNYIVRTHYTLNIITWDDAE